MASCTLLPFQELAGQCDLCGTRLGGRRTRWCSRRCSDEFTRNHRWTQARSAAVRRDKRRCVSCGCTDLLEVNHIVPRVGRGYGWGCHHHQSNLETLCHWCHVLVTNAQREARRTAKLQASAKLVQTLELDTPELSARELVAG